MFLRHKWVPIATGASPKLRQESANSSRWLGAATRRASCGYGCRDGRKLIDQTSLHRRDSLLTFRLWMFLTGTVAMARIAERKKARAGTAGLQAAD